MSTPILTTKLYIPPPRPNVVRRPRLIERLSEGLRQNQGFGRKLTLISAPAGFGKTTLVSSWIYDLRLTIDDLQAETASQEKVVNPKSKIQNRVAWLSLDEGDNDPTRFLAYLVAALQTIAADIGAGVLAVLQAPQPPPTESILTALLNEIATIPDDFVLVLDDYHVIEAKPVDASMSVDDALAFLLEHLPPQMHLVIATREDPNLPLARLRVQGQLTELRVTDLRFTPAEAAAFLNQVMDLNLSAEDIVALETRTEGWIAGLQLAAISMQGYKDVTGFIKSFTGSHHFVLDYLVEEVLEQQPESIQTFLLHTSILDRLCGPLCDAVVGEIGDWRSESGNHVQSPMSNIQSQAILEYLQHANLFIVPLDNERCWYRYHRLFAGFLRQRLRQGVALSKGKDASELHCRASQWYEDNGLEFEAFHHAVTANDIDRAARLVEGEGMPLHFRGAVTPVLNWLVSLPKVELDARPALWVMYASALSMTGQTDGIEEKLQAAEAALEGLPLNATNRNLIGHIAAIRALLAATRYQVDDIIAQSQRALEYLHPDNLAVRTATIWKMGIAYQLQGDRAAASQTYMEAISIAQASGNTIIDVSATTGLGSVQESENQLHQATETYRRVLQLIGDPPRPIASEAYLGLARIYYQWNDLDAAQQYGQQSFQLAQPFQNTDRIVPYEMFLAQLKLAQGDVDGVAAILARLDQFVSRHNFAHRMAEVASAQVLALLRQGKLAAAAQLAEEHKLPLSQARVYLAQENPNAALALLEPFRQQMEAKGWPDERLKVMVLQAVALQANSEEDQAMQLLGDALALAEPGGFIRIFVDEGMPMAELLKRMKDEG